MRWRLLIAMLLIAAPGRFALADPVHFTGETTADTTLITDALRVLQRLAQDRLQCATLGAVRSEILPPRYVPPGGPGPEGAARTVYERWTASLCGKEVPFLLGFWPAAEGGTMFRVQYPFPAGD